MFSLCLLLVCLWFILATMAKVAIETLHEALIYDPDTGLFTWRERPPSHFKTIGAWKVWNKRYAGKPALAAPDKNGYPTGAINGRTVYAHRIAWAIYYGEWPEKTVDHINRKKADNRIKNLRLATMSEQGMNMSHMRGCSSRFRGVSWFRGTSRWSAQINVRGSRIHIGYFLDEVDAAKAYDKAASERFGKFANLNFPEPVN